jgi:hypothetical protein
MPAAYPPEERERITLSVFQAMEGGKSLREACRDESISEATVLGWIDKDESGELSKHYARARDGLISLQVRELLDIVDGCDDPSKARVQIDARTWALSKLMPRRMSDKVQTEVSGPNGGPVRLARELSEEELLAIASKAAIAPG